MSAEAKHITVSGLSGEVLEITGVNTFECYQCGKCSAGCPLSAEMDYPPSYLIRLLQTGDPELEEKVLRSFTIWVCLTCEVCYSRCPMSIDIPKMMDFLREKSRKEGKANPKAKEIIAFHKAFLKSIEKTGRLYELGVLGAYKSSTFHFTQDLALAPKAIARGKLHFLPEFVKDRANIVSIFSKTVRKKKVKL
jgi:heterodisulfide reductase subunit C